MANDKHYSLGLMQSRRFRKLVVKFIRLILLKISMSKHNSRLIVMSFHAQTHLFVWSFLLFARKKIETKQKQKQLRKTLTCK